MEPFFPFIYSPKKKETFEPLPLYIYEDFPQLEEEIIEKEQKENNHIIIIDMI